MVSSYGLNLQVLVPSRTLMWEGFSLLFGTPGWWLLGHLSSRPTRNSLASCLNPMAPLCSLVSFHTLCGAALLTVANIVICQSTRCFRSSRSSPVPFRSSHLFPNRWL